MLYTKGQQLQMKSLLIIHFIQTWPETTMHRNSSSNDKLGEITAEVRM